MAEAFWGLLVSGDLLVDVGTSLWRLLVGLLVGSVTGVMVGLLTGRIKLIEKALSPVIQLLRPLPPVAIIPLIILWLGIGDGAKIFSIAFAVFFPVWVNTHIGAERISKIYLWSANLLLTSSVSTWQRVVVPASMPFIVAGIRIGIALGFIMVFVSELSGASSGIGHRISASFLAYRIDAMLAALIVLGALGAATDQFFVWLAKKTFPWMNTNLK